MDSIYVILVNYNNYELTIDCVESVTESSYRNLSIVIVDNASSDDSYYFLKSKYSNCGNIYVINSSENKGFSAGNNIGIKFALSNGADYIMLLNNDTVIDEKMIEILHSKASKNNVTTAKMYYYARPNIIWYAGGEIDYKCGDVKHFGMNKKDDPMFSIERNCTFVTGCCFMIHNSTINKVGLLDENYFMYGEDVDYSIRLLENDVQILYVPTAKLWHKVGGSSKSSKLNIYYDTRNKLYIMDKFKFEWTGKVLYRIKILLLYTRGLFKRNNDRYFKSAYLDYKKGIMGKTDLKKVKL